MVRYLPVHHSVAVVVAVTLGVSLITRVDQEQSRPLIGEKIASSSVPQQGVCQICRARHAALGQWSLEPVSSTENGPPRRCGSAVGPLPSIRAFPGSPLSLPPLIHGTKPSLLWPGSQTVVWWTGADWGWASACLDAWALSPWLPACLPPLEHGSSQTPHVCPSSQTTTLIGCSLLIDLILS